MLYGVIREGMLWIGLLNGLDRGGGRRENPIV